MSEQCRYFVPGPTWVRPEILAEMTRPMIGHRSAEFKELFAGIQPRLRKLFGTAANTFVATSSGTGILEGALLNCVPRSVLVTTCGAFSERWLRIAQQTGVEVDVFSVPWGEAIDPVKLADHIRGRHHHYDAVTITHNETSTGVLNDLETLAAAVHQASEDSLVLVDAVSSLGGAPIFVDQWGIDVCVASVQKGIALPPGITLFSVSERAMEAANQQPYRGTYFSFTEFQRQAGGNGVPFTPSIPHFFALAKQLETILDRETLEARWARHVKMRDLTLERTSGIADLAAAREFASPTITALRPREIVPAELLARMKKEGFTLGSGYGKWKETTFRIGHMGDIPVEDLERMLEVLTHVHSRPAAGER